MIPITKVKALLEELNLTHLVMFSKGTDGQSHVATSGRSGKQSLEAATVGNDLKRFLYWPEHLCMSVPWKKYADQRPEDGELVYVSDGKKVCVANFNKNHGTFENTGAVVFDDDWHFEIKYWAHCSLELPKEAAK